MTEREEIIAKLEKEVKQTYAIKTAIYKGGEKVEERNDALSEEIE